MKTLDKLQAIVDATTPGPWKYDWGNWEVEGAGDERHAVCALDSSVRGGYEPNPFDPIVDGEFIAKARNVMPALIEAVRAAQRLHTKVGDGDNGPARTWSTAWYDLDDALRALDKAIESSNE